MAITMEESSWDEWDDVEEMTEEYGFGEWTLAWHYDLPNTRELLPGDSTYASHLTVERICGSAMLHVTLSYMNVNINYGAYLNPCVERFDECATSHTLSHLLAA
jgi:hypothetical protein